MLVIQCFFTGPITVTGVSLMHFQKNGAKKLTNGNLLKNLIPVDEYIPIMYNRHPR